jgi:hypothetical protein
MNPLQHDADELITEYQLAEQDKRSARARKLAVAAQLGIRDLRTIRGEEARQHRLEAFAADPVGGFP